jgi:hypothetical protein
MCVPPNPDSVLPDRKEFDTQIAKVIEYWPLYRTFEFSGDMRVAESNQHRSWFNLDLPNWFMMDCSQCKFRQPHDARIYIVEEVREKAPSFQVVIYFCRACRSEKRYWLEVACTAKSVKIIKVGQRPALELTPSEIIASVMSESDLQLYRRALTCRNSNFGIAAVAYLRRIVENQTNFLIDLIADRMREEEPGSELLAKVEEVKNAYGFAKKMEFAKELLPKSVLIGGQNPVAHLHALTSGLSP